MGEKYDASVFCVREKFFFHILTVYNMGLVARKPVFGVFQQSQIQTSLLNYRD